jgi:hypothetical protein
MFYRLHRRDDSNALPATHIISSSDGQNALCECNYYLYLFLDFSVCTSVSVIVDTLPAGRRFIPAKSIKLVGFEVLTAVSTKMVVFWVVAPCSLVNFY